MLVHEQSISDSSVSPVFGMQESNGQRELLIFHNNFVSFSPWNEYEIIDERPSSFWISCDISAGVKISAFPEWFEKYFYENLGNDAPREINLLKIYYDFFMREYSQSFFSSAKSIGDNWYQCPECDGVFAFPSCFGVLRCEGCFRYLNNPNEDYKRVHSSSELNILQENCEHKNFYFNETNKKYYRHPPR